MTTSHTPLSKHNLRAFLSGRRPDLMFGEKVMLLPTLAAVALVLIFLLNILFGSVNGRRLTGIRQAQYPAVQRSEHLRELLTAIPYELRDAVTVQDADLLNKTDVLRFEFLSTLDSDPSLDAADRDKMQKARDAFEAYYPYARATSERLIDGESGASIITSLDTMRNRYESAVKILEANAADSKSQIDAAFAAAEDLQRTTWLVVALITLICILGLTRFSSALVRSLTTSLRQAVTVADQLAQGNTAGHIEVTSTDEVGQLLRSMKAMLQYLSEMSDAARAIARGDVTANVSPRSPEDAFGNAFQQMTEYLSEMAHVAGQIAEGNLAVRIAPRSATDNFGTALTGMVRSLSRSMNDLRSSEHRNRKLAEDLFASGEHLEHLMSSSPAVTYSRSLTDGFPVTFVSNNVLQHLGYQPEQFQEAPAFWLNHLHAKDAQSARTGLQQLLLSEQSSEEYRFLHADGSYRWIHDRARIVSNAAGEAREIVGWWIDVTDRMKAEESLRHSEEQLRTAQRLDTVGQLAGGVAHDFNNLLTAILSYSELLLDEMEPEDPKRDDIEQIKKAAERASSLTRQLLAFSRKQILQPRILNVNDVVLDMEKMLRRLIGEHVTFVSVVAPHPGRVKADPGQLEQVILNLALNASDAMPNGGGLTIESGTTVLAEGQRPQIPAGQYVTLTVQDTGCGMDLETQGHIYEPFFTTKKVGEGTGLGLATVHGIVKQSNGFIDVDSEVGAGTNFTVYLPRVDEPEAETACAAPPEIQRARAETVLLVEDEEGVRNVALRVLQRNGYTVLLASDGRDALAVAERFSGGIDLLLTDVVMPVMGGRELVDRLRLLRPETRVLFMSGYTAGLITGEGVMEEGAAFLQKPFTPGSLAVAVRTALEAPRTPGDEICVLAQSG